MILAIVQARQGSKRLPNKVLKEVNGKPIISILLHRLSLAKRVDKIILATSEYSVNDRLTNVVEKLGFEVFRELKNFSIYGELEEPVGKVFFSRIEKFQRHGELEEPWKSVFFAN